MAESCWLCPEVFSSKKELKRHIAVAPHSRLLVICPWCTLRQETYTRIGDLKRHCVKLHAATIAGLDQEFFGEPNGYWLSLHPRDYARVIPVDDYASPLACFTRELVTQWVIYVDRPTRVLHQWQEGWNAEGPEEPPFKRPAVARYSPSRPCVTSSDLSLVDIEYSNRCFAIFFTTPAGAWYEARLNRVEDGKHSSHLMRKLVVLQGVVNTSERPGRNCPAMKLRGQVLTSSKEAIATSLGIPASLIDEVTEWQSIESGFASCVTPTSSVSSPVHQRPQITPFPVPPMVTRLPGPFQLPPAVNRLPRPFPVTTSSMPVTTPHIDCHSFVSMATTPSRISSVSIQSLPTPGRGITTPNITSTPKNDRQESLTCDRPTVTPQSIRQVSMYPEVDTNLNDDVWQIKQRALELLKYGGMPLFPAARRDWDSDNTVEFPTKTGTLSWPPKGWKHLGSTQKLLICEYGTMSLEFQEKIKPGTTKTYLLDKYNFIILPGISTFSIQKNEEADHSARVKNCQSLIRMAQTGEGDHVLLTMLELATVGRDTSMDPLIDAIEKAGIRLRL